MEMNNSISSLSIGNKSINNNIISKNFLIFIFFILYIFVDMVSGYLHASSIWEGLAIGSVIFITLLISIHKYYNFLKIDRIYIKRLFLIFSVIFIQYLISKIIFVNTDSIRFILTYSFLFFIFIISALFVNVVYMTGDKQFHSAILILYKFLLISGLLYSFLYHYHIINKDVIIFGEPSHFAMIYSPLLFYIAYFSKSFMKFFHLFIGIIIAFYLQNMTLLAGIVLILILLYRRLSFIIIPIILLSIIIANMSILQHNYFLDRLQFFSYTRNSSTLVYLSGWERAYLSFLKSYGFGVGFDQMGIIGPQGKIMHILAYKGLPGLNKDSGGENAAKLITELGISGIILIFIYIYYFFKIYKKYIMDKINNKPHNIFFAGVFLMFLTDLFVRSSGYFTPGALMTLAAIYWFFVTRGSPNKLGHTKPQFIQGEL